MAQTNFTPILTYGSTTATNVPLAANLTTDANGVELAVNAVDGKLFYKDNAGVVQVLATKAAAQNTFSAGTTGLTPNVATSGAVVLSGTLAVANGGTGVTASTGTGSNVLNTSPVLVSPALGTPTALVGTNITGTAAGLTAGNATTNANLTGAVTSVGNAASLGSFTSAQLATALTDETGTGANVFATSPTLVTPALGTPSSGVVTNLTGTASININGTVGATTPAAGSFTTLGASGAATVGAGLAVTGAISATGQLSTSAGSLLLSVDASQLNQLGRFTSGDKNAYLSGGVQGATEGGLVLRVTNSAFTSFDVLRMNADSGVVSVSYGLAVTGTVTSTTDATLSGVRVGKGAGAIASNTAVGSGALNANTTGSYNTASGYLALYSNTTGSNNTASGQGALYSNTTGNYNTASGLSALYSNTTGNYNTASGGSALYSNTTGSENTASGLSALYSNTTGNYNTAHGVSALYYNTTGTQNTASGKNALISNTTGGSNTAHGVSALYYNTTGSGNTALNPLNSAGAYAPVFNPTTANNRFCMGSTGVTDAYIQVAWTVVSDARDKINFAPVPHGLEFVKSLQPTAYQFRTARDSEETNGRVRYGFKAQDILALEGANPVIVDNEDVDKLRMVDTALIPVLVKALQELNAKFDAYVLTHP